MAQAQQFSVDSGVSPEQTPLPFPVFSLKEVQNLDREEFQKLGDDVVKACHEVGFLYIKDTGIPDHLVDSMWKLSLDFFEGMTTEHKMKFKQDHNQLGYKPFDAQVGGRRKRVQRGCGLVN